MPKRPARPFKCVGQWRAVPLLWQCAQLHRAGSPPRPVDANPSTASPNRTAARPHVRVHGLSRARRGGRPRPSTQSPKAVCPVGRGHLGGRARLSAWLADAVEPVGRGRPSGWPTNRSRSASRLRPRSLPTPSPRPPPPPVCHAHNF